MAETILNNIADFEGDYGASPIVFSSNQVSTTIISGITATKSADKAYWVNGPLTYTIVITNTSGEDFTNGVLTDTLNTTLITLDTTAAITINGTPTTDYTYAAGLLTINLPTIADGQTVTVAFKVVQI